MQRSILSIILLTALAATYQLLLADPPRDSGELTAQQKLERDIFRELIEINTTVNMGSTKAAEAMATRLRKAGFAESDVQLLGPTSTNMNLLCRFRGTGKRKPILFIAHLDVVEALRSDWSVDPFTFTERDGYFYGRGTTDMKCEVADLVANLIRLKKEGYTPDRDIILALTDDEESGDANGVKWLIANKRPLIEAEFCINPDAGGGDIRKGKHSTMGMQTSEKVYISYQMEVKNPGGHSSLPVRENAIYRLASGIVRLSGFEFPVRLNETTRKFFERMAARVDGQTKRDMMAIASTPIDTIAARRLAESSAYYNALMRTTVIPTMLNAGHAENALPQTARAVINCRMLPDDTSDTVLSTLRRVIADSQVVITPLNTPFVSPVSPLRKDVMNAVETVTAAMWPGVLVIPVMGTGASDGASLRRAGIPVYGISGMFTDIDDVRAHGKDERIGVKEFYEGVDFMYRCIKELTSGS